ncbi:hypothetical protein NDI37_21805 [Funiculus sociatus GB2-A5]|uniref:Uncharacterized protein n=1 Tax=Funiculus sociatus GB2-A5 TaxID=2933946 RepID=A0ABV0JUF6_9CYAN|nr:hypothetical protein [Trichocoleus sp. FACHB-6]MBD2060731.1 hypothetical protein [Trichocoleus sp. FACHB-6]
MDKTTADRLTDLAPMLGKFLSLHPDEQEWLLPLLGRAERRTIRILDEISNHALTFEEIGRLTDTHPNTVKQTLQALSNGGLGFRVSSTGKWLTPVGGRKRKLLKL